MSFLIDHYSVIMFLQQLVMGMVIYLVKVRLCNISINFQMTFDFPAL